MCWNWRTYLIQHQPLLIISNKYKLPGTFAQTLPLDCESSASYPRIIEFRLLSSGRVVQYRSRCISKPWLSLFILLFECHYVSQISITGTCVINQNAFPALNCCQRFSNLFYGNFLKCNVPFSSGFSKSKARSKVFFIPLKNWTNISFHTFWNNEFLLPFPSLLRQKLSVNN